MSHAPALNPNAMPARTTLSRLSDACHRIAHSELGSLLLLAALSIILHALTNGRYGFHRDELASLDDGRHLAWGYVAYPPLTPLLARIAFTLFGPSLIGMRFSATLAISIVIVLTGLMARDLGGRRFAQIVAAVAAAISPVALFHGSVLMYTSFDYLWWVLTAYLVVRLLKSEDSRWWLAIGAAIGAGLMTKYTMAFLAVGVLVGVLFTRARRHLRSPWFWCGIAICVLIFLPNLLWQIHHDFATLQFLKSIHARDVGLGRADGFLHKQLWSNTAVMTVPLWLAGLYFLFFTAAGKRYCMIGWMFVVPFVALFLAKGREYYLAPAYPMLIAAGAVWIERWKHAGSPARQAWVRATAWQSLLINGAIVILIVLRIPSPGSAWWNFSDNLNGGNFSEEFGWKEMTETVAGIRDSLPAADRTQLGILAGDAGEAGALNLYGPAYGLPRAISGSNSHWLRGYGDPPPQTVITVGSPRDLYLDRFFESCVLAGHLTNRYGIRNAAVGDYTDVFVCRNLRQPWPEFWKSFRWFG
jgi:hypothetical protein